MNKKLTQVEAKTVETLQNLVWFRITENEEYIEALPNSYNGNFHYWFYYMKYEFYGNEDSMIQAIIYLNGKHYHYFQTPEFLYSTWVHEIYDTDVRQRIVELGGEIYEGFELRNTDSSEDEEPTISEDETSEYDYTDLPF